MGFLSGLFGDKTKKAEAELRGIVKRLNNNLKSAYVGKSLTEKVGIAQEFARECEAAELSIRRKYALTEDQTEKMSIAVNKDLARWGS
jgi:hypothetical protein